MVVARTGVFVWATGVAKLLSGESQCKWAHWFRAHFKYDKQPSEFDSQAWSIEHAGMLEATALDLCARGYSVQTEGQNWLRLESNGITLGGKPDIIAVKDDQVLVIDIKTGARHAWHFAQMAIYLIMLPFARPDLRGLFLQGKIQYKQEPAVMVAPDDLTDTLRARLREVIHEIGGPTPPARVPTAPECAFCDIGSEDCSDRIETDGDRPVTEHDLF